MADEILESELERLLMGFMETDVVIPVEPFIDILDRVQPPTTFLLWLASYTER